MDNCKPNATHVQIALVASRPYACSYLPERQACAHIIHPNIDIDCVLYEQLLQQGFRRSGKPIYRPHCPSCNACTPIRIAVEDFAPNRSQRRCLRQYSHLRATLCKPLFKEEHYALYRQYQQSRHRGGSMDIDDPQAYSEFVLTHSMGSVLIEFHEHNTLKMVALMDVLPTALSAVYTFYAYEPRSAYGTYAILWQIAHAQQKGLEHLYLGYWIPGSTTMHYKHRFKPCEVLQAIGWQQL